MQAAIFSKKKVLQYRSVGVIFTELQQKIHYIQQNTLFKDLSVTHISLMAQKAVVKHFPPHTLFIAQDDYSNVVYFITKGSARIYRLSSEGEEVNIGLCGPGDIIGEMALLSGAARSANVQSIQEVELLEIHGTDFIESLRQQPDIAINLLRVFSTRLQNNNIYMEEVLSKNLPDRTYAILQSLAKYFTNNDILLSQEELAIIVGATRSRVTEVLNMLADSGKITLAHKKIHIT